jgi:hypothetical protein
MATPNPDKPQPAGPLDLPELRRQEASQIPKAGQGRMTPGCPRCQVALEQTAHGTGIAWRCVHCGGESLIRRMIPELHANEIWLTVMEQPVKAQPGIRCPECCRDMAAVLIPFRGREIELDLCAGCQRLWMTPQEDRPWSIDEKPERKRPMPPVIRMKGRGLVRNRTESLGSGPRPAGTGGVREAMVRLWALGILLAAFWLLLQWLGW